MTTTQEQREAAQRVLGFVRAHLLLSNTDRELIGSVHIMLPGVQEPKEFDLRVDDLELLVRDHLPVSTEGTAWPEKPRCADRVPDFSGVTETRTCGLTLNHDGTCPRPEMDHVR